MIKETKNQKQTATLNVQAVPSELWNNLQQIDFELIEKRMLIKYKWEPLRVKNAIESYVHFLYFTQLFDFKVTPTADIDEIWHQHILHTFKYSEDCNMAFGFFLHHFPFPSTNDQEKVKLTGVCCNNQDCCNDDPRKPQGSNSLNTCFNDKSGNTPQDVIPYEMAYLLYLSIGTVV